MKTLAKKFFFNEEFVNRTKKDVSLALFGVSRALLALGVLLLANQVLSALGL